MSLQDALSEALGEPVGGLTRLSSGASRETWRFTTASGEGRILQLLPRGSERAEVGVEAAVLDAAARAGVPVARVIAAFTGAEPFGMPGMVLEALPGESLPPRLMRQDRYAAALGGLATQCGEILGRLHAVPLDDLPPLNQPDPIERCYVVLDSLPEPHPTFELVLRRLALNRPPRRPPALVHGDFRLGNLLIDETGVTAVLDWELVHQGDPLEDLGYLCVPAWRFGGRLPVAGAGEYEQLLEAYEATSGVSATLAELLWWQAAGTVWWGVLCHVQAARHLTGATRSVELAAIGRRACEQEWDALLALESQV